MATPRSEGDLLRDARLRRRAAQRCRDTLFNWLRTHPTPTADSVYRAEQELIKLNKHREVYERLYDELSAYVKPVLDEGETDTKRIAEATKKAEDQWVSDSSEVSNIHKEWVVKVQVYRDTYEGTKTRSSLVGGLGHGNSTFAETPTVIVAEHRLKPLEVPKFDGDPRKFLEFKELFENLIHNNLELSNVQKMHRLKEALIGDAAETARAFQLQEKAYPEAWAYLCLWYENKRGMIGSYLKDLFSIQRIRDRTSIRKLVMDFDAIIRSLISCDVNADQWSVLLSYHLRSKLDDQTRLDWDNSVKDRNRYPTYESLKEFLVSQAFGFDDDGFDFKTSEKPRDKGAKSPAGKRAFSTSVSRSECRNCKKGQHLLIECADFSSKSPHQRYNVIKKLGICLNCFGDGHSNAECRWSVCKECGQKHHTLLHFSSSKRKPVGSEKPKSDASKPSSTSTNTPVQEKTDQTEANKSCSATSSSNKFVVLSTAVVRYCCGKSYGLARILLDTGSQSTTIADTFVHRRRLPTYSNKVNIGGVGGKVGSKRACTLKLLSRFTGFEIEVNCDVLPATSLAYQVPVGLLPRVQSSVPTIKLAESKLDYNDINIVIGGEYYEQCILNRTISIDSLTLRDSHFGWTISGPIDHPNIKRTCTATSYCFVSIRDIDRQVRRFIDCEEVSKLEDTSAVWAECEAHFNTTYTSYLMASF